MAGQKEKELGPDYNGELTALALKRLNKEKDNLGRDEKELAAQGMYFSFEDARSHKAVALIVGPDETPYFGGFYLFEFTFPNTYPLKPPHVKFLTGDSRVRFNPNLYVNGKVCLSILGTWQGPSWTAACTFRTTLFSIQSLLHSKPLQNEPGYESEAGKDCVLYSSMLRYENVNVAVMQLGRVPDACKPLRATMARVFIRQMAAYEKVLDDFDAQDGKQDKCPLYGFVTRYAPNEVRKRLTKLREKLLEDPELSAELSALTKELAVETAASSSSASAPTEDAAESSEPAAKRQRVDA